MDKIYKYMKFRPEFFKKPSLRVSQRCALNDPFEFNPSQDALDKISEDEIRDDFFQQISAYSTDEEFDDTGVISFTETYNNLLMWSHYADEHKGIVVEFNYKKLKDHFNKRLSTNNSIERVLYNRERQDMLSHSFSPKKSLLTKSDDWIYEKEHRILTKVSNSDCFVVDISTYEQMKEFYDDSEMELLQAKKYRGKVKLFVDIEKCKLMDSRAKDGSSTDDMEEMRFSPSETVLNELISSVSALPTSIFVFQIPRNCITGVFIGCRFSDADKTTLRELLNNKIPCYKASLSKSHFLLDFQYTNLFYETA
jgi:hypothetical protein